MTFFWLAVASALVADSSAQDQGPLLLGGMQMSWDDDQENEMQIYKWFEREFFSAVQGARCHHDSQGLKCEDITGVFDHGRWAKLIEEVWEFVDRASKIPVLAAGVAHSLYSWFWWEGPGSTRINVAAARSSAVLLARALDFGGCRDRGLDLQAFYQRSCHVRWRYLLMILSEVGRILAVEMRDISASAEFLAQSRSYFQEMRQLPAFGPHAGMLSSPYDISWNRDFFPASVVRQGPVWQSPLEHLPIASFLERSFDVIRSELSALLEDEAHFAMLNRATRSAEPQFGPQDDDWLTAYLVRDSKFSDLICPHAPRTCELLRTRPEIAECRSGGSGAGFLRVRPGGRLKPHYGNAPRLSAHLALIVPRGEIYMAVGGKVVHWEESKVLVFDDTFIHSVVHNGEEPRYVLNVWMCHPCDTSNGCVAGAPAEIPEFCSGPEQGVLPPEFR